MTASALLVGVALLGCGDSTVAAPEEQAIANHPPVFSGQTGVADHDLVYSEQVNTYDRDGDSVTVRAVTLPGWLAFDSLNNVLHGLPGEENIGEHLVELAASDGLATADYSFTLNIRVGTTSLTFEGSWNQYLYSSLGGVLGHDSSPFVSTNFVVYSGFSSMDARQYVAEVAEESFAELKATLSTGEHEFEWTSPDHTIDIFADKLQSNNCGLAYTEGFLVRAWDTPGSWCAALPARFKLIVKHELMHVVQGLLMGPEFPLNYPDDWFTEGVADHMAGGSLLDTIVGPEQLAVWQAEHSHMVGGGNPVSIHVWGDFPAQVLEERQTNTYYPYFALAFRYLIDPEGLGRTLADVKDLYFDIRSGISFTDAFAQRMGISVTEYETQFFTLMESYLSN